VAFLIQGIGLGLAAAVQPGPLQTFLTTQALTKGWKRAWPAAFAPLVSDGFIISVVLVVLSQIPAWIQRFLYLAGGFSYSISHTAHISRGATSPRHPLLKRWLARKVCSKRH